MHDVEGFLHKLGQISTKTRQIAHTTEAVLRRQQSMVPELRNKKDAWILEQQRRKKDEIEDLVDLMRRYQQMLEMEKRDVEHMTALADICDKKQKRLELHTLDLGLAYFSFQLYSCTTSCKQGQQDWRILRILLPIWPDCNLYEYLGVATGSALPYWTHASLNAAAASCCYLTVKANTKRSSVNLLWPAWMNL